MTTIRTHACEVKACRAAEIFDDPAGGALLAEYAEECGVEEAEPQRQMYEAMESAGALQCFAAYVEGALAGFVSVLCSAMPHHGRRVATAESIFVSAAHRKGGAGDALLDAAERHAEESGCICLVYTARAGSRLDKVLERRSGCTKTHAMYTRRFR